MLSIVTVLKIYLSEHTTTDSYSCAMLACHYSEESKYHSKKVINLVQFFCIADKTSFQLWSSYQLFGPIMQIIAIKWQSRCGKRWLILERYDAHLNGRCLFSPLLHSINIVLASKEQNEVVPAYRNDWLKWRYKF